MQEVTKQEKDENGVAQSVVSMEYIYEEEMEPVSHHRRQQPMPSVNETLS